MSQSEARAWWADIQHVREAIERRRADERSGGSAAGALSEHRLQERPLPHVADTAMGTAERRRQEPEHRLPDPLRGPVPAAGAEGDGEPRRRSAHAPVDRRAAMVALAPGAAAGGKRRTVQITGHPGTAHLARPLSAPPGRGRQRAARVAPATFGHRPDRVAMWAAILGFLLIIVAAMSAHA
jgi:hypothetical protein